MFNLYRILTVLINLFLVYGIFMSLHEIYSGKFSDEENNMSFLFPLISPFVVSITTRFVWKTRKFKPSNSNLEDVLDIETTLNNEVEKFRFQKIITIMNFYLGILIVIFLFYLIYTIENNAFKDFEGIFLILVLALGILYGILKIYFSYTFYKKIIFGKNEEKEIKI